MGTQIPETLRWGRWESGPVSRVRAARWKPWLWTDRGGTTPRACAPVRPGWQRAAGLLRASSRSWPEQLVMGGCSWPGQPPDSDLGGEVMLCSEDQNSGPANRHGRGGLWTDRQPLWASQARSGYVLPTGCQGILVPGLAGEAADASPGQVPIQDPRLGWQDCCLPEFQAQGEVGREHCSHPQLGPLCLALCPLLCQFLSTCYGLLGVSSPVSLQGPECVLTQDSSSSQGSSCPACFGHSSGRASAPPTPNSTGSSFAGPCGML